MFGQTGNTRTPGAYPDSQGVVSLLTVVWNYESRKYKIKNLAIQKTCACHIKKNTFLMFTHWLPILNITSTCSKLRGCFWAKPVIESIDVELLVTLNNHEINGWLSLTIHRQGGRDEVLETPWTLPWVHSCLSVVVNKQSASFFFFLKKKRAIRVNEPLIYLAITYSNA